MSVLSDVQQLYGSLQTTWEQSRAHLIAHAVLVLIVFVICGAALPQVAAPQFEPKQVIDNDWFKLAKDTGLVYVALAIPFLAIAMYLALLGKLGQFAVMIIVGLAGPRNEGDQIRGLSVWELEPLALMTKREDFSIHDILAKVTALILKFQSSKSEIWRAYEQNLKRISESSAHYLGDYSIFLVAWIGLFWIAPATSWTQANRSIFWAVALILLALIVLCWVRVQRALSVIPRLQIQVLSLMARGDPELATLFDVSAEERERVTKRVEELLQEEEKRAAAHPSLRNMLASWLGLARQRRTSVSPPVRGRPFPALYRRGDEIYWDRVLGNRVNTVPEPLSFGDLAAYLYYRIHDRISQFGRMIGLLIRYLILGVP